MVDKVAEGILVHSLDKTIEGRTTGKRQPCSAHGCPGWFLTVRWETGQLMHICSEGWNYDPESRSVRVTGGGEISARCISPKPRGTPPRPRDEWPSREQLSKWKGWR